MKIRNLNQLNKIQAQSFGDRYRANLERDETDISDLVKRGFDKIGEYGKSAREGMIQNSGGRTGRANDLREARENAQADTNRIDQMRSDDVVVPDLPMGRPEDVPMNAGSFLRQKLLDSRDKPMSGPGSDTFSRGESWAFEAPKNSLSPKDLNPELTRSVRDADYSKMSDKFSMGETKVPSVMDELNKQAAIETGIGTLGKTKNTLFDRSEQFNMDNKDNLMPSLQDQIDESGVNRGFFDKVGDLDASEMAGGLGKNISEKAGGVKDWAGGLFDKAKGKYADLTRDEDVGKFSTGDSGKFSPAGPAQTDYAGPSSLEKGSYIAKEKFNDVMESTGASFKGASDAIGSFGDRLTQAVSKGLAGDGSSELGMKAANGVVNLDGHLAAFGVAGAALAAGAGAFMLIRNRGKRKAKLAEINQGVNKELSQANDNIKAGKKVDTTKVGSFAKGAVSAGKAAAKSAPAAGGGSVSQKVRELKWLSDKGEAAVERYASERPESVINKNPKIKDALMRQARQAKR
jgi:hypothetical protein